MTEVRRSLFGLDVKINDEYKFINDEKKAVTVPAGLKISDGKSSVKVTALQLLSIMRLREDEEFMNELRARAIEEKKQLMAVE